MKSFIAAIVAFFVMIQSFFASLFGKTCSDKPDPEVNTGTIAVTCLEGDTDYYCDGESTDGLLRFGVEGDTNLFAPGETVSVVIDCDDSSLYGTAAKVIVTSGETGYAESGNFTFENKNAEYGFSFSSALNGIFDITLKTTSASYTFSVGVVQSNDIASDDFYYGIQPYITRAQCWGENYRIPGMTAEESIDAILDTAEYMGVNLVREDGIAWSSMQSCAYGDLDYTVQDYLVNKVTSRNMKYNWILGGGTTGWSVSSNYKDSYDASSVWAYAPDETMWEDYITKLADHYSSDENIIWEIWNEPNWVFFNGTQEEYFTLLENTAKILKSRNASAYVYSGGLAVAERDTNLSYFVKFAQLINDGTLDNWGYHNHDGAEDYCDKTNQTLANARSAGLTGGGINSESGSYYLDASLIARKALYTRATGADGFVSFSFRQSENAGEDVNHYAFFNEYLQPTSCVISYATVIRFLGNATLKGSTALSSHAFCDEYTSGGKTIYVYYAFGETATATLPADVTAAYDMYGNAVSAGTTLTVTESPVYVIV